MKFLICQIPLHLNSKPFKIANIDEHIAVKRKCVEYAMTTRCDVIIFPEYTYDPSEKEYMLDKSSELAIFAGSYQDAENYNQTIVFVGGNYFQQAKKHTSPYEKTIPNQFSVKPSEADLSYYDLKNKNCFILTCFDYFELAREKSRQLLGNGEFIDILISPCCNNNPEMFIKEAEAIHSHRDNLTSIICNVSRFKKDSGEYNTFGKSAVFGLYDKNSIANIKENGWHVSYCENMIAGFPEGDFVCEIDLQIPYHMHRMGCLEFSANPIHLDFKSLGEL